MSKRGFTLAQTVASMVILSLIVVSLMNLTSKINSQQAVNTDRQTLQLVNINKIESLNAELNTAGNLPVGDSVENMTYGFSPCQVKVSVSEPDQDNIYTVKVSSRFTGKRSRTVVSEVLLTQEARNE